MESNINTTNRLKLLISHMYNSLFATILKRRGKKGGEELRKERKKKKNK